MFTLPRRPCRQFVALARRAFSLPTNRLAAVTVAVAAGRAGPVLWATRDGVTLALGEVAAGTKPEVAVPLSLLADVMQRSSELTLEATGEQVTCRYAVAGVPQVQKLPVPKDAAALPDLPALADPGEEFLAALRACARVTDVESSRYALSCVRLRGQEGDLAATDSRQALLWKGFTFPFAEEVLLPRPALLRSREFEGPAAVGLSGKTCVLRAGEWTVWLPPGEGRFPNVNRVIPSADEAVAEIRLDQADAAFLDAHIEGLPGISEHFFPATVDVSAGRCVVRARGAEADRPVELPLTRSQATGQDLRLAVRRADLATAVALGAGEIRLYGPDRPLVAAAGKRTYLWMPLDAAAVVGAAANAVRIELEDAVTSAAVDNKRKGIMTEQREVQVPTVASTTAAAPVADGGGDLVGLIRRADAASASLSVALQDVRRLSSALRKRRRAERLVKTTLEGIRKLKTLDAAA